MGKWIVTKNGRIIKEGFNTELEAFKWADKNLKYGYNIEQVCSYDTY